MKKNEIKKLWKYFVFIFLIAFCAINWNDVSWLFNYKVISGAISGLFQRESQAATNSYFESSNKDFEPDNKKENTLEIPKIGVSVPLVYDEGSGNSNISRALDRGAVIFPASVLPGDSGQTVVLGHSAPPNWPKIKYDWVFSRVNELETGDEIFVYFNNKKFTFHVTKKIFLEKGEEIPKDLTNSRSSLVLITCWPPGQDIRRIAVAAE